MSSVAVSILVLAIMIGKGVNYNVGRVLSLCGCCVGAVAPPSTEVPKRSTCNRVGKGLKKSTVYLRLWAS